MLLLTVISLAPAVLLMTTSFVRIVVVLGLLRQAARHTAVAAQPSHHVDCTVSYALVNDTGLEADVRRGHRAVHQPANYARRRVGEGNRSHPPLHERANRADRDSEDVWLFYRYLPQPVAEPKTYDEVPLVVLLPAYILSELKTAFLIGFQIYLPFLVLDIVVASVTISMGMMMLPPVLISLPFKLLLFVLVDGWHLVVEMLLESFQPFT